MSVVESYSGKEINRAGEMLISDLVEIDDKSFSKAMDILSFWRFSHETPLESAFKVVQDYATEQDRNAICAKRLKRHASISLKLKRFKSMNKNNSTTTYRKLDSIVAHF